MDTAQKDLTRAQQMAATQPEEARALTQRATQAQDEAQVKLKQLLSQVSTYQTQPAQAGTVVALLRGNASGSSGGNAGSAGPQMAASGATTPLETPAEKQSRLVAELNQVNQQIAGTQAVLRKLNASIQSDRTLFSQWESDADAGFDRCVSTAGDVVVDFGAGELAEHYATVHDLAVKLPTKPDDLIEKYRYLASLAQRLKEAKAANDVNGLAAREGKTDAELFETFRDGVNQISGLLGLDKTLPGAAWKYGCLASDMAYNLTELRQLWKNVSTLQGNNERYAEAVKKLTERMQHLVERSQSLQAQIEAGEAGPLPAL